MTHQGLEAALAAAGLDNSDAVQVLNAAHLAAQHYPPVNPGAGLLIRVAGGGITGERLERQLQALLVLVYPPDHPTTLISAPERDGAPLCRTRAAVLGELAQADTEGIEWLYVPPLPGAGDYTALQNIAARLRAPDGCPWDRALTWDKLRASLLEETHELLAALDAGDTPAVAEEQGDLLLQVALQTQIALEEKRYRFPEVIHHIVEKLIRRHPHVFGDEVAHTEEEVLANWEAIKRAERAAKNGRRSLLAGIPPGLPALAQADAYLDRVSRLRPAAPTEGAPWSTLAAAESGDVLITPEMVGEALLGFVAWARNRGIDAESALRAANASYAAEVEASLADE